MLRIWAEEDKSDTQLQIGLVAQLNSALDFGSSGCRFESCRAHTDKSACHKQALFLWEQINCDWNFCQVRSANSEVVRRQKSGYNILLEHGKWNNYTFIRSLIKYWDVDINYSVQILIINYIFNQYNTEPIFTELAANRSLWWIF